MQCSECSQRHAAYKGAVNSGDDLDDLIRFFLLHEDLPLATCERLFGRKFLDIALGHELGVLHTVGISRAVRSFVQLSELDGVLVAADWHSSIDQAAESGFDPVMTPGLPFSSGFRI